MPDAKTPRPLSPFMLGSTYKLQLTSALSFLHRLTGIALVFGLMILVAWLASLASGPENYGKFVGYMQTTLGQLALFGVSLAFFYHFSNGIRHLLWDMGLFLDIKDTYKTGRVVIVATICLTAILWLKASGVSP